MLVVDASVTLAWIHAEERTSAINAIAERVAAEGCIVPSIWSSEIANAVVMAMRRKRMTQAGLDEALATLRRMPIKIEQTGRELAWRYALPMAIRHKLTVYDATYLELAVRKQLPLATLDDELIAAARAEGIPVLP
jgi:predicted nucleic acid-binding protein